mgnify:CR=1 FL=1
MRLADFILRNMEPILVEWEAFARDLWPNPHRDPAELRERLLAERQGDPFLVWRAGDANPLSPQPRSKSPPSSPVRAPDSEVSALSFIPAGGTGERVEDECSHVSCAR